jgi:phosphoserine aminotransferase
MELNHRGSHFHQLSDAGKNEIRKFLNVPDTHTIMLNQGGATA